MSTAAKPAEYKQVTVLFADVVHSMDIAAAVGAERLREIMTDLAMAARRWSSGTAARSTSSRVTASWPCSAHLRRWRTTPSVHAWRPWGFVDRLTPESAASTLEFLPDGVLLTPIGRQLSKGVV